MADNEFLDEYVLDANDQLSTLNEALVRLEKNPGDTDAIDSIFRAAHTLKGNSATMGFMEVSDLAHKMENVLDEVRQGRLEVTGDKVDVLFEALDALEYMVENLSQGGSTKDCSEIIGKLNSLKSAVMEKENPPALKKEDVKVQEPKGDPKLYKVMVRISKKSKLKSVRAFMVLKNLESLGTITKAEPDRELIEKGEFKNKFTVYLSTDSTLEEIKGQIKSVAEVESSEVAEEEIIEHMVREHKAEKEELPTAPHVKEVQSIRVGTDKLDALVNLVGELVINKSRFTQISREVDHEQLSKAVTILERLSKDLQDLSMSLRTVKVAHVFDKFPRMVRDLAKKEGKEIEFIVEGKDIELDRTVLDRLGDPLVHLLRNCVDHGIESTRDRAETGKPVKGTIKLLANRVKDHVEIVIEDDGKGIDTEAIKASVIRKGLLTPQEIDEMDETGLMELIFRPGVSGAKKVTDVSGRGVGMDVVKTTISKLGGSVHLDSELGVGSVFTLKLPLTLAIVKALLVRLNNDIYAIPTKDVVEVLSVENFNIKKVKGKEVIIHRGDPMPVLRLGKILNSYNGNGIKDTEFVVVERSNKKVCFAVERIIRQEEVVIKPLDGGIGINPCISGATILGDGKVALILDICNLN